MRETTTIQFKNCVERVFKRLVLLPTLKKEIRGLFNGVFKADLSSSSGTFHTYHWGAERLPSMEEEERATQKQKSEDIRRENAIVSTWKNAKRFSWKDPECEPLAKYFLSRCLKVTDPEHVEDLRFSPKISYLNPDGSKNEFCAMIAAIRDSEGKLIAVHKTFLTKDGKKASVETPKKISCLPSNVSLTGCAIRIGKPTKYLAVAEGIETALSVSIGNRAPLLVLRKRSFVRVC